MTCMSLCQHWVQQVQMVGAVSPMKAKGNGGLLDSAVARIGNTRLKATGQPAAVHWQPVKSLEGLHA